MPQYNYQTQGSDSLPSVAERCGHSGEWQEIIATNPWLEGLDYLAVPPGSQVLLPMDWVPSGIGTDELIAMEVAPAPRASSKSSSSSSASSSDP
jgi:hypothetical protein